ncbi:MAG: DUF309 domain-containing protein [Vicinamibacteria bacterium]
MIRATRRPFPPYRHLPGTTPHPERSPEGHMYRVKEPEARLLTEESWTDNEDFLYGVDLFNAGYFWEAHTFWERLWALEGTEPEIRSFLQALIQMAAACLKRRQGRIGGAKKLLRRARLNRPTGVRLGVDLDRLHRAAQSFIDGVGDPPHIEITVL